MIARNRGFGLIEIMVGLAVGLVSMLVIFQLYATFENQKRTTTAGGDSQTNGALALYELERQIRSAGNGITEGKPQEYPPVTGCLTNVFDGTAPYLMPNNAPDPSSASTTVGAGVESNFRFAPAVITNGAAGPTAGRTLSDSITIVYGTSVISAPYTFANALYVPGGPTITLTSTATINPYDMLVAIEQDTALTQVGQSNVANTGLNYIVPKRCVLMQATAVPDATTVTVAGGRYNKAGGTTLQPTFSGEARLYNLGSQANIVTYRIAANNLVADVTKFGGTPNGTAIPTAIINLMDLSPMASNIVNMQAQYGVDTDNPGAGYLATANCPTNIKAPVDVGHADADGVIDPATGWVEPTGTWLNDGVNSPALFDLRRIRAVRIGLVARSGIKEVPKVGACSSTTTQPTIHWDSGPDMKPDLAVDPEWQCYRYKVFQTTIPLRNAIWSSTMNPASPSSCGLR